VSCLTRKPTPLNVEHPVSVTEASCVPLLIAVITLVVSNKSNINHCPDDRAGNCAKLTNPPFIYLLNG